MKAEMFTDGYNAAPDYDEDLSWENDEEPWYELEDSGCRCTESGVESEWEWNYEQQLYICAGCGDTQ